MSATKAGQIRVSSLVTGIWIMAALSGYSNVSPFENGPLFFMLAN